MRKTCRYEPVSSGLSYCIARGTFPATTAVPPSHRPLRLHQPTTADTSPPSPSKVAPDADADADVDAAGADAEAEARSDFLGTFCAVEPLVVLEIFGFLAGGLDVDVDAVAEVRD